MRRNYYFLLAGIIILAIMFFLFLNPRKRMIEYVAPNNIELQITESNDSKLSFNISGDEVINLYAQVARLQAELNACRGKDVVVATTATTVRNTTKRPTSNVTRAHSTEVAASNNESIVTNVPHAESSRITSSNITISQYSGVVVGDHGVTFDENNRMFYYVRKSLYDKISNHTQVTPSLNGKDGAKAEIFGDYLFFKTDDIVTVSMLETSWKYAFYIGDFLGPGDNYDMWLPHELVKLNEGLKNNRGIYPNKSGGYFYESKINFESKKN